MSSSGAHDVPTPAERLRALELSGDPDAREIARRYRASPMDPMKPVMREVARSTTRITDALRPNYDRITEADADEAEEKAAAIRAQRERKAREREVELHKFAASADTRERSMLKLTIASVVIAVLSGLIAVAALMVAVSSRETKVVLPARTAQPVATQAQLKLPTAPTPAGLPLPRRR